MQSSNTPPKLQKPFAAGAGAGYIRTVPVASQPGNAASYTDGFPPTTFLPISAGGVPPDGRDFNGLLNSITSILQWFQAGYFPAFDAAFATQIGGYPVGAILRSTDGHSFWRCTTENNSNNPDTGGAGWAAHGVHTVFGRTGPDITAQAGDYTAAQVGALASNALSNASVGTNGYQVLPSGLIMQWGTAPSTAEDVEQQIFFPIAFPNACFQVQATGDYGRHTDSDVIAQVASITTSGCWIMRDSGGGAGYVGPVYWFALGR